MPKRNAYLLIGSAELFRKRLASLCFNLEWNNLPELEGGFAEHYREYPGSIDNSSFEVRLSALSNASFRPYEKEQRQLFRLFAAAGPDKPLEHLTAIDPVNLTLLQLHPDYTMKALPEYSNSVHAGYFKIQLDKPAMAFGHSEHPRLFGNALIAQSKTGSGLFGRGGNEPESTQVMPREPYVPVINKITAEYKAATSMNMRPLAAGENDVAAQEKVFTLFPFGIQEIFAEGKTLDRYLFPRYEEDGYFYIGLEGVKPGKPIALFFHIRESKQRTRSRDLTVRWEYLRRNRWIGFAPEDRLSDGTRNFTTTGIIRLRFPDDISADHSILPPGICWIRATAKGALGITGRILDVQTNAVEVEWVDNSDITHYDTTTQLPRIRELAVQKAEIASVFQPLDFYGGRPADQYPLFYIRTSERLRHKNRGINSWDIERLVLEYFPFVRRAKCVTWMEYPQLKPGQIKLVVIPMLEANETDPMLGFHQLDIIGEFLREKISHFAQIEVINPVYEKLKISCNIRLQKGLENEQGMYLQQLHKDLEQYICPWLNGASVELGGSIGKNELLEFINTRPYVRFATRFSVIQIFEPEDEQFDLLDTARPSDAANLQSTTPWSVLTPVAQHNITFIRSEAPDLPEETAIEDMRLGTDFIILKKEDPATNPSGVKEHDKPGQKPTRQEWFVFPK